MLARCCSYSLCLDSLSKIEKVFLVAMAEGSHPFPSRTRKLSPLAPMVLPWRRGGRVGNCQVLFEPLVNPRGFFYFTSFPTACRFAYLELLLFSGKIA